MYVGGSGSYSTLSIEAPAEATFYLGSRSNPMKHLGTYNGSNMRMATPIARTGRLLVEALEAETLIYDLQSHTAHCLNAAAAHVWTMADGTRTVSDIVTTLP